MANSIFVDTKQIDRLCIELKGFEKEVGEATRLALNRTMDHAVTKAGQLVSKIYSIKSSEVKESFKGGIKKASISNLSASVTSIGHTLSLAHFPHNPNSPIKKGTIKVKIKKGEGYKAINTSPKPFNMTTGAMSDDKVQFNVFKRVGKARFPVKVLRTLSIPQMITAENIAPQIQEAVSQKFNERLEHEIIRQMTSMSNRIGGK